jgi:carbon-monoxide dehydrogenase iron sulfur subunit
MMKGEIVVKPERCTGCLTCEVECKIEHSKSKNLAEAIKENPAPTSRVTVEQAEKYAVPLQCRQCENAPCMTVCPTAALHRKDDDGPVLFKADVCIGCKACVVACPFGVIEQDEATKLVVKCDQCIQRLEKEQLPACVTGCPTGCLEFTKVSDVAKDKRREYLLRIEC